MSAANPGLRAVPTVAVEIRKWTPAPSGTRRGFVDVAVPAWGLTLHDCAVFKKVEESGAVRISIALPNKKVGDKWLPAVSWIDHRSDSAAQFQRSIVEALTAFIRSQGGGV